MDSQGIEEKRFLRAFIPSKMELVALPVFSLLFLTLINSFQFLRSAGSQNYTLIVEFVQLRVRETLSYIDSIAGNTLPTLLFWMLVGTIVYVLLWVGFGAWQTWRNDLPPGGKRMIVPHGYNHGKLLRGSIVHLLVRSLAIVLLTIWGYYLFAEVLPYLSSTFLKGFETLSLNSVWRILSAVIGLAFSLFFTFVLARCVVLRERVFS